MSNGKQYKYTIIIPHYKLPIGLRMCLESIPNRPDLQVVVVDDASDEKTIESLRSLEKTFPYVEFVYSNQNGYGGKARNIGLSYAQGDYIVFSDADDTFTVSFNQVLDDYKETQSDMVFFKTNILDAETHNPILKGHHLNEYIDLWDTDKEKSELYLRYMFGEPWCKMIKRQVVVDNNIRFDETRINNDTTFSYLVGHYSKSVAVDQRAIYNYMIRTGSTSRQKDIDRYYIKINVFGRSELFFRQHNIPLNEDRQYLALSNFVKRRDNSGFKKGFHQLEELGYDKKVIRKNYSRTMGYCKFLVPIWNVFFAPDLVIKLYCLYYWFSLSIPRLVKYRLLGIENNELRRY